MGLISLKWNLWVMAIYGFLVFSFFFYFFKGYIRDRLGYYCIASMEIKLLSKILCSVWRMVIDLRSAPNNCHQPHPSPQPPAIIPNRKQNEPPKIPLPNPPRPRGPLRHPRHQNHALRFMHPQNPTRRHSPHALPRHPVRRQRIRLEL